MNYCIAHMNIAAKLDPRQTTSARMMRGRGFLSAREPAAPFAFVTRTVRRDLLVLRS